MTRIRPKIDDRLCHHRPDVRHHEQFLCMSRANRRQRAKMLRQRFGGGLAHMTNTQRVDKARQRGFFRGLNRIEHVLRGFLRHAIQLRQLLNR